ncbi:MAG: hypothetical protein IT193_06600 [Propionibacteriaceae bacterium]|nr:hypothetical protein [Propionibacteriaceae bacterium]
MVRIGRLEEPVQVIRPAGQQSGPEPTRFWGQWTVFQGVLTLTAGLFLLIMFISMGLGGSPAPWGPINDFLSGIANLLLAALIPVLSRRAARSRWERLGVKVLSGASVVGAAASLLLVAGAMGFEQSTAVSMAVISLQVIWMLWLNRRFLADPGVPRLIARFGTTFAVSMLAALIAFGVAFGVGTGSMAGTVLQAVGGAVGGVAWLAWPAWFVMLGRHLVRTAGGASDQA